jgi:DNA-binding GntR family transcriptional regulator
VPELQIEDLEEISELRRVLEERLARRAPPELNEETLRRVAAERRRAAKAHKRILAAVAVRDADRLVAELDAHRDRALAVLRDILV